jgi:UDP:flavonoid glycosyltransferase YjiC (YdhE family)
MRLLAACSLGGAGHLNPLLPFLDAAYSSGSEVLVVGPPALETMVRDAGFSFHAGGEPEEADIAPIRERLLTAPRAEATVLGNRDLFGRLATSAMLPAMEEVCQGWHPDLVLREPCEYASAVVASSRSIPIAQVAISTAAGERRSIDAAAPVLEQLRRGLVDELTQSPYLTRFPASMDPTVFVSTLRYRETRHGVSRALPDWWHGSRAPIVYVTLGSVLGHMTIAPRAFEILLDAAAQLRDVRVLLTTGRAANVSTSPRIPPHVHVETWVNQADVLNSASVVICHGGSGTTLGSLAAGVPMVVVPFFADQFDNAEHVRRAGAGIVIDLPRRPDGSLDLDDGASIASRIARATDEVARVRSFTAAASKLSNELASRMDPGAALAHIVSSHA